MMVDAGDCAVDVVLFWNEEVGDMTSWERIQ